jgi:hypothetical protein
MIKIGTTLPSRKFVGSRKLVGKKRYYRIINDSTTHLIENTVSNEGAEHRNDEGVGMTGLVD